MARSTTTTNESMTTSKTTLSAFCQFVPLRLTANERALLQVLESTLEVSEYTDQVDTTRRANKVRRILDGILEASHIATGLAVASGKTMSWIATNEESSSNSTTSTTTSTTSATSKSPIKEKESDSTATTKDTEKQPDQKEEDDELALKSNKTSKKSKKTSKKNANKPWKTTTTTTTTKSTRRTVLPAPPPLDSNLAAQSPKDNALLFQTMFEIGRRNKVLNPSAMRSTYGKLMYLLQDAQSPSVAKSLGFSLYTELQLVAPFLEQRGAGQLLHDKRLGRATRVVSLHDYNNDRTTLMAKVQAQKVLRQELVDEYSTSSAMTKEDVERVLESIRDALQYVDSNVRPVQTMLEYLEEHFEAHGPIEKEFSLELRGTKKSKSSKNQNRYGFSAFASSSNNNSSGPTLSHSHTTQYTFCWQSLQLWSKVQQHMHQLWVCADTDLLSISTPYNLTNTGQGLQRVQACPTVAKIMRQLLQQTQQEANAAWVGLSVVHLGDRDVPNALVFIDKYTQIPRFLTPLCAFLKIMDDFIDDENADNTSVLTSYIDTHFESPQRLQLLVLCDYFKHGFDGSGDDGGSCIDGRLTSSWNWTSLLSKKSYYHSFLLTGFTGFDGDF